MFLYQTGVLTGPPLVYLIGNRQVEGKVFVKVWTAPLVEIFHPGLPQVILWQENSREIEGGRSKERESDKGVFDSIKGQGHDLSAKQVSVFQEDSGHKGKISTLFWGEEYFIKAWLICYFVPISALQQCDSVSHTHVHSFYHTIPHHSSSKDIGHSSLWYRVGPHCPTILNVIVCIY